MRFQDKYPKDPEGNGSNEKSPNWSKLEAVGKAMASCLSDSRGTESEFASAVNKPLFCKTWTSAVTMYAFLRAVARRRLLYIFHPCKLCGVLSTMQDWGIKQIKNGIKQNKKKSKKLKRSKKK